MSRYMEVWTFTEDFGVPRWREEWELTQPEINVKIEPNNLQLVQRKYILLDMEMIQTSRNHACVRKLYALLDSNMYMTLLLVRNVKEPLYFGMLIVTRYG